MHATHVGMFPRDRRADAVADARRDRQRDRSHVTHRLPEIPTRGYLHTAGLGNLTLSVALAEGVGGREREHCEFCECGWGPSLLHLWRDGAARFLHDLKNFAELREPRAGAGAVSLTQRLFQTMGS